MKKKFREKNGRKKIIELKIIRERGKFERYNFLCENLCGIVKKISRKFNFSNGNYVT